MTAIDLATRYPEAIPLKSATAEELAEGLLEIFSRHGLPQEILSDQGTQLTGKVMNQLCAKLHIKQITTTPYHPAANGCVERLHRTLVPMLRKAISSHLHWPKQVKLCLFALRSVPNRSTRYSPFELLYGRGMNSPINLGAEEWEEYPSTTVNIPRWMQLGQRLDVIRASTRENGLEARAKSKAHYDRNTKTRDIPEGSMVLLRTLGSWRTHGRVSTRVFVQSVSPVNIEISLPGRGSRRKQFVHINHVKLFNQPECRVLCVMAVAEDQDETPPPDILKGDQLTTEQLDQLQVVLDLAKDTFSDEPGNTDVCTHAVDTGDCKPIRSNPHAISPIKLAGVKQEIQDLL